MQASKILAFVVISSMAVMINHVITQDPAAEEPPKTKCQQAFTNIDDLCYNFTTSLGDYLSVQDVKQRDGWFAIREAALYIAYQKCNQINNVMCYYAGGVQLENEAQNPTSTTSTTTGTNTPTTTSGTPTTQTPTTGSTTPTTGNTTPTTTTPTTTTETPTTTTETPTTVDVNQNVNVSTS